MLKNLVKKTMAQPKDTQKSKLDVTDTDKLRLPNRHVSDLAVNDVLIE